MPTVLRLSLCALSLCSVVLAQRLTKGPIHQNLDYLEAGVFAAFPSTSHTTVQMAPEWIAQDCMQMTQDAGLDPSDVTTYWVTYTDCDAPWIICRHKDSPSPLENLFDRFGKLPVKTRQFVRHLIALPDPAGGHAFNENGNIAMFNIISDFGVFIHEAGHSLDLQGAYADQPLSSSSKWLAAYDADTNVTDPYAATNQLENVAQNTYVAAFNENVYGGYQGVEPNHDKVFHQYATVTAESRLAGDLLRPGGHCWRRLTNSPAVLISNGTSRVMRRSEVPDTSHPAHIEIIPDVKYHTGDSCELSW